MSDFKIPPVSPLLGSSISNYFKILHKQYIAPRYYLKILLTTLIVFIAAPFQWWENMVLRRRISKLKIRKSPLFIIGHWRSGTTLLHNLLCQDPTAAYVSTYQSVFPNNLLSKWLFGSFMRLKMPATRPSDNVELNIKFPQEDEYSLSNCNENAYYNFFYFPNRYKSFFKKSVRHEGLSRKEITAWNEAYVKMLKKAILDSGGERLVLKNPVNTARIDILLKLFPDAKFLYIYRNPVTVFYSTQRFFQKLLPTIWLQEADKEFLNEMIFDIYKELMDTYQNQKKLIPEGNLMEIKYEELEKNPADTIKTIYASLLRENYEPVKPFVDAYLKSMGKYRKNSYLPESGMLERINKHCGRYMEMYNYEMPAAE